MTRRAFLKASALAPVLAPAVVAMGGVPAALSQGMPPLAQFADELNTELFSSDGLAVPIAAAPTASKFAAGLDRTLVLGGGGEYYVAWYCGFFHGLFEQGVDAPSLAEMIVGTSAGLVCRILHGIGPLSASSHRIRLLRTFPEPVRATSTGDRAQCQPDASPEDKRRRQRRILDHFANHRARGARFR
jgi:hypothetical protein